MLSRHIFFINSYFLIKPWVFPLIGHTSKYNKFYSLLHPGQSADPLLAATGPLSATRPKRPPASTAQFAASRSDGSRVRTPEPVAGRKHMEIQTDNYLEELTDKPHEEHASTQTDMVLDR